MANMSLDALQASFKRLNLQRLLTIFRSSSATSPSDQRCSTFTGNQRMLQVLSGNRRLPES
jgi:hypothetical protein